jgi:hypothetical protein
MWDAVQGHPRQQEATGQQQRIFTRSTSEQENFIGDKISINPIIPFIAEVR